MSLEVLNDASDTQLIIKAGGFSILLSLSRYLPFFDNTKNILSWVIFSNYYVPDIIILKEGD